MKYWQALILLTALTLPLPNASAETAAPAAEPHIPNFLEDRAQPYGTKCMAKLDFGMQNFMTGWTNILSVPGDKHVKQKGIMPIVSGIGEGLILGCADTVVGFLNAVTFPVPAKFPLPKGGVNVAKPTGK